MNAKLIKQIANEAKKHLNDQYDFIGIRIQEDTYGASIGDNVTHNSSVWDDGNQTEEYLDGVCAIDVTSKRDTAGYAGNIALVLGSYSVWGGEDPAELIMQDAVILDIIEF